MKRVPTAPPGQRLLEMAGANIEVHIVPETLDRTADNEMKLLGERLSRSGLTVEQHCKNSHTTPEALRQRYRDEAESRVRVMLAARAIAEAEQIVVHRRRSAPSTAVWPPCRRPPRPRSARC